MNSSASDRLIVALDLPTARQALEFISTLEGQCRWFKVGLQLFLAAGPGIVTSLRERGFDVFLDLKLHDIPNTVASAIRAVGPLDPSLLTVHAAGGEIMLRAAQEAAAAFPQVRLLGVTVLTSMDDAQLEAVGVPAGGADQVLRLGRLARTSGLPGLVCSAEEILALRTELDPATLLVVPGIRPEDDRTVDDQRRIATPAQAIKRGASMLVVGRPITRAANPAAAAAAILKQMDTA